MTKHVPALVATLTALAALLPSVADARTIAPSRGAINPLTLTNCWTEYYGAMWNTCASNHSLDVPLPVDNAGNTTVNVTAIWGTRSSSSDTTPYSWCDAYGLDAGFTTIWDSTPSTHSSSSATTVGIGTYVPGGGSLGLTCSMQNVNHGARLLTINF
jgi:hypothetical protein